MQTVLFLEASGTYIEQIVHKVYFIVPKVPFAHANGTAIGKGYPKLEQTVPVNILVIIIINGLQIHRPLMTSTNRSCYNFR